MAKGFGWGCAIVLLWATLALAAPEKFGGIGLQVVPLSTGDLVVLKVVAKTPAAEGGMRPGDMIVEVDGFPLRGSEFTDVVTKRLWGRPGTTVTLRYLRPGERGTKQAVLRRVPMEPRAEDLPGVRMMTPKPK